MKKILNLVLVLVPMCLFAQGPQAYYADAVNAVEGSTAAFGFEVNDLLLADPDFDIQEDMVSYTKDGKEVFFSANKKLKLTDDNADTKIKNSSRIHLFKADVAENGKWVNLEMLPFNGSNYSTGHPALNKDDSKLYFASDGPGSTGKTDLFAVDLFKDGTYGKPENLGNKVNSEEREIRPYVDAENVLYFASDEENEGKFLEVYASPVINGEASTPVKLDVAVDSPKEELIASYKAWYAEAVRKEEAMADMMDLAILQEAERLAEIERLEKELVSSLSGSAYDFDSSQMVYTVQIGAFLKNVKTGTYKEYSGLFNHQYPDGYNRFYSGVFATEQEALDHLQQMKEKGFNDAFVIGLQGEKRLLD